MRDNDKVYFIDYKIDGVFIDEGNFSYNGDNNSYFDTYVKKKDGKVYGYTFNYDVFDSFDKAKIVKNYILESNHKCDDCIYEEQASLVCGCKNCKFYSKEFKCELIYKNTGLIVDVASHNEPCLNYIPKYNSCYKDYFTYRDARNNCDYNWCIDSNCNKFEYMINNEPDFYTVKHKRHNNFLDYKLRDVSLILRIKNTKNYFESIISYSDFLEFNFIIDGKIKFDKLYVFEQRRDKNRNFKYKVFDVNKFYCKNLNNNGSKKNIKK